MKRFIAVAGLCLALVPAAPLAQETTVELGKQEYIYACAGCHGDSGKGTGPLAELLSIETPDLTRINERTGGGNFPYRNTTLLIDGRNEIRAHGGTMPIWGDRYMAAVRAEDGPWVTPESAELMAMGRILALVQYLETIQQ